MSSSSLTSILTRKYLLVLALLFALSMAAFLVFEELLSSQGSAEVLNQSGRERMLTHRIALYSTLLVGTDQPQDPSILKAELRATIAELQAAHDFLAERRGRSAPGQEQALTELDRSIQAVITDASFIAEAGPEALAEARAVTGRLVAKTTAQLLGELERFVVDYQNQSKKRLEWLHIFAVSGEIAVISLLLFTGFAVFRPLVRDIGDRVKQLEKVEAYYRSILNNVGDGVVAFDRHMAIRYANAPFEAMAGRSAAELMGQSVSIVLPEIAAIEDLFAVRSRRREFVRRQEDGSERFFDITIYNFEFEGDLQCIVSLRDISERKHLETRLQTFFHGIEHSPLSIVITDTRGVIEYANRRCTETSGYQLEEIIGCTPRLFKSGHTPSELYENLWGHLLAGREWYGEFLNKRKNGELYWEFEAISALKNERGEIAHFIAIKEDITENKRQAAALLEATRQAEVANRSKSEFLANMSHELRTPLNAIIGFGEVMAMELFGAHGNDKYKEYSEAVLESARHLLSIINDILDYSKLEAGRETLYEETARLDDVIGSIFFIVKERAGAHGVSISVEGGEDVLARTEVRVDVLRYKQILLNIISNAIKFTAAGGRVTIRPQIQDEGGLLVEIVDTGIGMKPDDIPRALERFGQVDSTMTRKYEGTGLGLPISKALIELHGGSLTLTSTPGVGTSAAIILPPRRVTIRMAAT